MHENPGSGDGGAGETGADVEGKHPADEDRQAGRAQQQRHPRDRTPTLASETVEAARPLPPEVPEARPAVIPSVGHTGSTMGSRERFAVRRVYARTVASTTARAAGFLVTHAVAGGVIVAGSVGVSVVAYFALLLLAILSDGGPGGPLALPGMMLMACVASIAAAVLVLFPVTALTQALCARVRQYRWIAEIVVSSVVLIAYVSAAAIAVGVSRGAGLRTALTGAALADLFFLILLGVYWWSGQAATWLLRGLGSLGRRLRRAGV